MAWPGLGVAGGVATAYGKAEVYPVAAEGVISVVSG